MSSIIDDLSKLMGDFVDEDIQQSIFALLNDPVKVTDLLDDIENSNTGPIVDMERDDCAYYISISFPSEYRPDQIKVDVYNNKRRLVVRVPSSGYEFQYELPNRADTSDIVAVLDGYSLEITIGRFYKVRYIYVTEDE